MPDDFHRERALDKLDEYVDGMRGALNLASEAIKRARYEGTTDEAHRAVRRTLHSHFWGSANAYMKIEAALSALAHKENTDD